MRWQAPDWVILWGGYKIVLRLSPEGASLNYYHADTGRPPSPEIAEMLDTIAEQAVQHAVWAVRNPPRR